MVAEEGNNDKKRSIFGKIYQRELGCLYELLTKLSCIDSLFHVLVEMNCFSYCNAISLKICQDICISPFTGKTELSQ